MTDGLPAPDVLASHTGFLKNLARSLLGDEQAAEDVVQDAFVVAIEKPPRPGNLRAWLASVVRHLSLSRRRTAKRRNARERAGAQNDGLPPVDEVVSRMELQRRVVSAVLALDEPYRSVIAHRFLYEKSLAEIARESKTPTATVRTRLRRGLDKLRARLDADADGHRAAWSVGLLALLAQDAAPPVAIGAVVTATVISAAAVLLGLLAWWQRPSATFPTRPAVPPGKTSPSVPAVPDPISEPPVLPVAPPPEKTPTKPHVAPTRKQERTAMPLADVRRKRQPGAVVQAKAPPPGVDGFVRVGAGRLEPGATRDDMDRRATNDRLRRALAYEVADGMEPVAIPEFLLGRYEVTNAQWKHYLDAEHRITVVADGQQTLDGYVREHGVRKDLDAYGALYGLKLFEPVPAGRRLVLYRLRLPRHWYGLSKISKLQVGREWVDLRAPAATAFRVPQGAKAHARDFGAYPVRSVSPAAMLAFAEWAGCQLPSEYEFERAGRGRRGRSLQHPGKQWDRSRELGRFAFADNPRCGAGPLRVDDESVGAGPPGVRHLLGNVWELTRTFYDLHPGKRVQALPSPPLANYALVAKGASFGDRWQFVQLSTRTPTVGDADLDLRYRNRADSLGLRLVRHDRPGYDLLSHSLRRVCYDAGTGQWRDLPHRYAMKRMAGVDRVEHIRAAAPYVFVRGRARGIAFVPRWSMERSKIRSGEITIVGILRSDVPLVVGVPGEAKDGDDFWRATRKTRRHTGFWRTGRIEPGEWRVAHWHGHLALLDAAARPVGLLLLDRRNAALAELRKGWSGKDRARQRAARVRLRGDVLELGFVVDQDPGRKGTSPPPGVDQSQLWALCEVSPWGWPGRREGRRPMRLGTTFRLAAPLK